jgi:hypothetical protein
MSTVFPKHPPPVSSLGRYRLLSPTAGVRVSPLCLGAMNFGDKWKDYSELPLSRLSSWRQGD